MNVKYLAHGLANDYSVTAQITDLSAFINASPNEVVCVYYTNEDYNEDTLCVSKKSVEWLNIEPV